MARIVAEFEEPVRLVAQSLREGRIIGLATDTTYALVAAVSSRDGVAGLRKLRSLSASKPLSLLLRDFTSISRFAYIDRGSYRIMKHLTPGKYTFVLRATKEVPRVMMTSQRTVGIRICGVPIVDALCESLDEPLVSASAALADGGYGETAEDVAREYPSLDLVFDGGHHPPEPSTVIDLIGPAPKVLRMGSGPLDGAF